MANGTVLERDDLYRQMWSEPGTHIAKRLGIPVSALYRACDRLAVPRPTSGHWARVALGATPEQPPLAEIDDDAPTTFEIPPLSPRSALLAKGRAEPPVVVPEKVKQLHPLLRARSDGSKGAMAAIHVSAELQDRAVRIMHTILVELDRRKMKYRIAAASSVNGSHARSRVVVELDGVAVSVILSEWFRWVDVPPKRGAASTLGPPREHRGDGRLRLSVYTSTWHKPQRSWRDDGPRKIEQYMNAFFAALYTSADHERRRLEDKEEAAREREAEEDARRVAIEREERFKAIVADARERVEDLKFVGDLRLLADRIEHEGTPRNVAWAVWARKLAVRWEHDIVTTVPDVTG